ncbi:MAG: hypothetical protein WDM78_00640 [Puia sp.]
MKFARHFVLYATLIVVFGGLIFYLLNTGRSLDHSISPYIGPANGKPDGGGFFSGLYKVNLQDVIAPSFITNHYHYYFNPIARVAF